MPACSIRVLVVEDYPDFRRFIVSALQSRAELQVICEVADGNQAVEFFEKLKPDLALMDLRMPGKDGIQATVEIRKNSPRARVLMLTTYDGDDDIHRVHLLARSRLHQKFSDPTFKLITKRLRAPNPRRQPPDPPVPRQLVC